MLFNFAKNTKIKIMDICLYEDWMRPQIASLHQIEYGINESEFEDYFAKFYDHPYQLNKCVRVVAKDGDKIIGFQTFFSWPYRINNVIVNSYQSGKSLVHPDYRGKGLFQKMLNYLDTKKDELKIDFLMGFPVEQSKNSFIRNNWENILNLKWFLKIVNPFAFVFKIKINSKYFDNLPIIMHDVNIENNFRLSSESDFVEWRRTYMKLNNYSYFNFSEGDNKISFSLKLNKRNKWLNEMIIGDVVCSTNDINFIKKGFKKLKKASFKSWNISVISIALNTHSKSMINKTIEELKYLDVKRSIYFIVKPFVDSIPISKKENWTLYRSDIDTW